MKYNNRNQFVGNGFTLVELLVVIAIAAILASVAIPGVKSWLANAKARSFTNDFVMSVMQARSRATELGSTVTLCPSADGSSCALNSTYGVGWILLGPNNVILSDKPPVSGLTITGGNSIAFSPAGLPSVVAFQLTVTPDGYLDYTRYICVLSSGRTHVYTKSQWGSKVKC